MIQHGYEVVPASKNRAKSTTNTTELCWAWLYSTRHDPLLIALLFEVFRDACREVKECKKSLNTVSIGWRAREAKQQLCHGVIGY